VDAHDDDGRLRLNAGKASLARVTFLTPSCEKRCRVTGVFAFERSTTPKRTHDEAQALPHQKQNQDHTDRSPRTRRHLQRRDPRGLAPEHLDELPQLGYAFIAAAVIGGLLAWRLVSRPHDRRLPLLAAAFCLGQIGAWALFVTLPVPGFAGTPESIETIGLVSKAFEALGVLLALSLITFPALRSPRRSRRRRPVLQDG
jgi:hypothetical protein